ncbi:DUF177 domain-containing protein [Polynucleobacter paneuropaeus]|nr:DUF177 domain-containing protein [Polynucleobacter paneuropaeus]
MNRNQVLPQVVLSGEPSSLRKIDFCAPQTYQGKGFLPIEALPRVAEEVSEVAKGDGFDWTIQSHFTHSPGSDPNPILDLSLNGELHLVCQRCLKPFLAHLAENRQFLLMASEAEADAYPIEDDELEPLVASQHFNLLETIEDEILLSLPLIPKHPDGACSAHLSFVDANETELSPTEKRENPFNILKNMKKSS